MLGPSAQCRSDSSATVEAGGRVGGGRRYLWYAPKKEAGMNGVVVLDGRRLPYFTLKYSKTSSSLLFILWRTLRQSRKSISAESEGKEDFAFSAAFFRTGPRVV